MIQLLHNELLRACTTSHHPVSQSTHPAKVFFANEWVAAHSSVPNFKQAAMKDATLLHRFLECRNVFINLKLNDPRVRVATVRLGPVIQVSETTSKTQGFEMPETFFVDLKFYNPAVHGPYKESDIVMEDIEGNGVLTAGVSISEQDPHQWPIRVRPASFPTLT